VLLKELRVAHITTDGVNIHGGRNWLGRV